MTDLSAAGTFPLVDRVVNRVVTARCSSPGLACSGRTIGG